MKQVKTIATIAVLAIAGSAGVAQAGLGGNFTVNENAIAAGTGTLSNVDSMNYRYQAIIDQTSTNPGGVIANSAFTESGYASLSAWNNDASSSVFGSNLNSDYSIFALFKADGLSTVASGAIMASFSHFAIEFYALAGPTPTFTNTDSSNFPTYAPAGAQLWATANLIDTGEAHIFSGLANGDYQVDFTNFGLNAFGTSILTDPSPFYNLFSFTGVTTTISGASVTAPFRANVQGSGDMFFTAVPEPASLTLLGVGLLGFGVSSMRRKQK